MQDHYLYVYLDPRKPGKFNFAGHDFGFEPFYVGVSKNAYRKYQHLQEAKKYMCTGTEPPRNKRKVYKIASILKSGQDPIIEVICEKMIKQCAYNYEFDLIKEIGRVYDNTGPLLNFLPGGQIINSAKISEKKKEKKELLNQDKSKQVFQFDLSGNFIRAWQSVALARRETSINHIDACCRGDRGSAGGYKWQYAEEDKIVRRDKYRKRKTNNVSNRHKVEQLTLTGIKVNEYSSITQAANVTGISRSAICNMLMNESKTAGGYKWRKLN